MLMTTVKLRKIRLALGLSQEAMARLLGLSFATVNRLETGNRSSGTAGAPRGLPLEVYRALDYALDRQDKAAIQRLVADVSNPGHRLYRIFRAAYG